MKGALGPPRLRAPDADGDHRNARRRHARDARPPWLQRFPRFVVHPPLGEDPREGAPSERGDCVLERAGVGQDRLVQHAHVVGREDRASARGDSLGMEVTEPQDETEQRPGGDQGYSPPEIQLAPAAHRPDATRSSLAAMVLPATTRLAAACTRPRDTPTPSPAPKSPPISVSIWDVSASSAE